MVKYQIFDLYNDYIHLHLKLLNYECEEIMSKMHQLKRGSIMRRQEQMAFLLLISYLFLTNAFQVVADI